jgi:ATP-dependent RNA helicase DeaD
VGTPGRLLDLIRQKALDLSGVETVILDEADEMLSMGFIEDIETILSETPATRQTTLFSATLPPEIRRLAEKYMSDPQSITMKNKQMTVAAIEQRAYMVNESDKLAALTRLFEMEEITSGLVFARTRVSTGELANELTVRGFPAEALNGDLNQDAREQVLERFRQNQIKVLVATDVAARGLDIDDISHVFNFDLPHDPEIYVHRIGRTGRAGKTGIAITLFSPGEQRRFQRIEGYTKQRIPRATLPTVEEIHAHREAQLVHWLEVWLNRGRSNREKEIIVRLVELGHDPLDVAAAALKIARAEEKQRPIAAIGEIRERPSRNTQRDEGQRSRRSYSNGSSSRGNGRKPALKAEEKGMVRLTLSAGKAHGVRPADIVGSIAFHADIPGHKIGAIHIQDEHTLFDVPQQLADQVLNKAGSYKLRRQPITISRI